MTSGQDTTLEGAKQAWKTHMNEAVAASSKVDWSKVKIKPEDISVSMGPALSEEEFKKMCALNGTTPTILKKKS